MTMSDNFNNFSFFPDLEPAEEGVVPVPPAEMTFAMIAGLVDISGSEGGWVTINAAIGVGLGVFEGLG